MADNPTLEVWKVTIDVQKHFNDLGLKVRSMAVAILAALLAAAGYALKDHETVFLFGQPRSLAGLVLLAALTCWLVCYLMDRWWYHRLLQAAVVHGRKVEAELVASIPAIGLTGTIDDASPIWRLRAQHRLSIFYGFIALILWGAAGLSLQGGLPYFGIGLALSVMALALRFWPKSNARAKPSPPDLATLSKGA